jgi:uncharacterized cupin superfamily protein
MSSFAIKNLMEIDDSAPVDEIEGRFARRFLDSEHLGVSYFRYAPGFRSSVGHRHQTQEEAYVVVGGSGRVKLDDEIVELKRWDALRVAPEVVRGFEAGADGLELIAVGADRPEGGDGEMVRDWWTD